MGHIEVISVFSDRSIAKNATTLLATPIPIFRYGPNDKFYADITASGGGNVDVHYQIGNAAVGPFAEPGSAGSIGIQKSSARTASRDRFPAFTPILSRWMRFEATELNASPVVMSMNLITVKR